MIDYSSTSFLVNFWTAFFLFKNFVKLTNLLNVNVRGTAKIAPIGPNTNPQNNRDKNITKSDISNSFPINFGLIILSTIVLITVNPITTIIAFNKPNFNKAIRKGGIIVIIKPILGMKLKRNEKNPIRIAKSIPKISGNITSAIAAMKPVKAVIDKYFFKSK